MRSTDGDPLPGLEADVDSRIVGVWEVVWGSELEEVLNPELRLSLAAIVRGVYMLGYRDALLECAEGTPGLLMTTHNFRLV